MSLGSRPRKVPDRPTHPFPARSVLCPKPNPSGDGRQGWPLRLLSPSPPRLDALGPGQPAVPGLRLTRGGPVPPPGTGAPPPPASLWTASGPEGCAHAPLPSSVLVPESSSSRTRGCGPGSDPRQLGAPCACVGRPCRPRSCPGPPVSLLLPPPPSLRPRREPCGGCFRTQAELLNFKVLTF